MTSVQNCDTFTFAYNTRKNSRFNFSLCRGSVDWKKIGDLDVDRLIKDQDVDQVMSNVNNVINYSLINDTNYNMKVLDNNFVKLFRLAQLIIDYLLHCKSCFENCQHELEKNIISLNQELDIVKKDCHEKRMIIKALKRKLKDRQIAMESVLYRQQNHLFHDRHLQCNHVGDNSHIEQSARCSGLAVNKNSFGADDESFECLCAICGKVFINKLYLYSHQVRRHIKHLIANKENDISRGIYCNNYNSSKNQQHLLRLEIKQLKERLNVAESKLRFSSKSTFPVDNQSTWHDNGGNTFIGDVESKNNDNDNPLLVIESGEILPVHLNKTNDLIGQDEPNNTATSCNNVYESPRNQSKSKEIIGNRNFKDDIESLRNMLHNEIKKLREFSSATVKDIPFPCQPSQHFVKNHSNIIAAVGDNNTNKHTGTMLDKDDDGINSNSFHNGSGLISCADGYHGKNGNIIKKDVSVNTDIDQGWFQRLQFSKSEDGNKDSCVQKTGYEQSSHSAAVSSPLIFVSNDNEFLAKDPSDGIVCSGAVNLLPEKYVGPSSSSFEEEEEGLVEEEENDVIIDEDNRTGHNGKVAISDDGEFTAAAQVNDAALTEESVGEIREEQKNQNDSKVKNVKNNSATGNNTVYNDYSKLNALYNTGRISNKNININNRLVMATRVNARTVLSQPMPLNQSVSELKTEAVSAIDCYQLPADEAVKKSDCSDVNSVSSIEDIAMSNDTRKVNLTSESIASGKSVQSGTYAPKEREPEITLQPEKSCRVGNIIVEDSSCTDNSSLLLSGKKPEVKKRNLISQKSVWNDYNDDDINDGKINAEVKNVESSREHKGDEQAKNALLETPIILITEHDVPLSSSTTTVSDFDISINKNRKDRFDNLMVQFTGDKNKKISSNNSSTSDLSLESLNYGGDEVDAKNYKDCNKIDDDDFVKTYNDEINADSSSSHDDAEKYDDRDKDVFKKEENQRNIAKDHSGDGDIIIVGEREVSVSSSTDSDSDGCVDKQNIKSIGKSQEDSFSLPTVQKLLASNPEIFDSLRKDLEELLDRRLRDLGVDPEWTSLPNKTFKTKMDLLKHHMKITSKRYKTYYALQKQIEEELDAHYCRKYNLNMKQQNEQIQLLHDVKYSHDYSTGNHLNQSVNHGRSVLSLDNKMTGGNHELENHHYHHEVDDGTMNSSQKQQKLYRSMPSPLVVRDFDGDESQQTPKLLKTTDGKNNSYKKSADTSLPVSSPAKASLMATSRTTEKPHLSSPLTMADIESDTDEEIGGTVLTMYNRYKGNSQHYLSTAEETESVTNTSQTSSLDQYHMNVGGLQSKPGGNKFNVVPSKSSDIKMTPPDIHKGALKTSAATNGKKKKRVLFLDEALTIAN